MAKQVISKKQLFGFWEYSSMPYSTIKGGEINYIHDSGNIEVVGLPNMNFKPLFILPYEKGKEVLAKIEQADSELEYALKIQKGKHKEYLASLINNK